MGRLLASRRMRIYLLGDTMSNFGDYALWLAAAIWVKTITGSTAAAGLVMFAVALGSLTLPLSGLLVDRVRRRPLLIYANLGTAFLVLALLLVHGSGQLWLIYLVMFLYGVSGSITGPAQTALLPALVPDDMLGSANGAIQAIRGLLRILSPLVGAGLFAWLGGGAVAVIDATTFFIAAATLLAIRVEEPNPVRSAERWLSEVTAGARHIARTPDLKRLVVACGVAMLVIGFFESIVFAVVTLGLHHSATFVAVLGTAQAIGTIFGGITAGIVLAKIGEARAVAIGLALCAAGSLLLASSLVAVVLAGTLSIGIAVPWLVIGATTALQRRTPSSLQGRAAAAFELGVTLPQTVSIALGASLIAIFSYRVLLLVVAGVIVASAVYLVSQPGQHRPVDAATDGDPVIPVPEAVIGTGKITDSPEVGTGKITASPEIGACAEAEVRASAQACGPRRG